MSDLYLDPQTHDLVVDDLGRLVMVGMTADADDQAAMIAQRVRCRLLWWRGEWYLDQRQGTPWREALLGRPSDERIKRALADSLLSVPGVAAVVSLTVARGAGRSVTVTWSVRADTGAIIGPETLDLPYLGGAS